MAGACCCCGSNPLALSTSAPNAAVCQAPCCGKGDGGAGNISCVLNAVGKWGSVLTAQAQGRPVAVGANSVAIGAKGATSLAGFGGLSTGTILLLLVVLGAIVFLAVRR